jgi:hypothetical protein
MALGSLTGEAGKAALGSLAGESSKGLGPRATLVNLLPASLLTLLVVALVGSGAPGEPGLDKAMRTFDSLDGARLAILGLAVLAVAVILQPFQIAVVQLLEGYWVASPLRTGSALARRAFELGVEVQRRRRQALAFARRTERSRLSDLQKAWLADEVRSYPDQPNLLPTRLGNVLRAAEIRAGGRYGLDAALAFPRLYPQMSDRLATAWEDVTDQLDTAAHMCVTFLLATFISAGLLLPNGWGGFWLLIPVVAGALTWVSYRATIAAAKHQGVVLMAAFDLHRFDLLSKLRYPLPPDAHTEFDANQRLTEFLASATATSRASQFDGRVPMEPADGYEHPPAAPTEPSAPPPEPGEVEPLIWEWDTVEAAVGGDGQGQVRSDGPPSR